MLIFAKHFKMLSSPRPKGLCAESARAVTCRQCPHSGEGEDFLAHQPGFFLYENGLNSGTKSQNRYQCRKYTVSSRAEKGLLTKIGVIWQKLDFWPKNEISGPKKALLDSNHVLATTGKSCTKKILFSKTNISLFRFFVCF